MSISENLRNLKNELPEHVTLVAVSKTKPISDLMEAYNAGQRIFGENKIQEMTEKWQQMPGDVEWHMIGHVQRNKVKYMAEFVSLIHGVDSLKLLKEIEKQAAKHQRVISCLLQIHIAEEDTKFGLSEEEALALLESEEFQAMKHVKITGIMGMATFTDNQDQVKREFQTLRSLFVKIAHNRPEINTLSMGMSGDYTMAIDCGSTMVRIGSSIFGARNYH
ncbi:YggS family pyridoxal phosphate-dependent enzyme [Sinomicrobium weinanense]|uniref:Pyridoxal phosphate homeostasis protein n=1 Tax=Sinomicrobium weinanense TaxID=2842200 RepID=A0A926Q3N4_9FLAO|nr:YggS family pyridoxal phosphate-dependent enzyme [Sinomicrobium weinanense]MBC9797767.1 YggS family pyridoxal phosphate-dependent enzyme [Sinomicrobium weinanense]MBU3122414.1 YggS family pyridoxal phosphate-dependent enzyme [Sinomicrobium weinanense]